jgi:ribonucleoside-diphosphate reductase alpha chain
MVTGHETISTATSILDYVFRSLGYDYLNRTDFIHKKAVDEVPNGKGATKALSAKSVEAPKQPKVIKKTEIKEETFNEVHEPVVIGNDLPDAISQTDVNSAGMLKGVGSQMKPGDALRFGYTGEQCSNCGSIRVKRNGSCTVCEDCGNTTGCS